MVSDRPLMNRLVACALLLALASCLPGARRRPVRPRLAPTPVESRQNAASLLAVEPSWAGASVGAVVTLRGQGFPSEIKTIELEKIQASSFEGGDAQTIRATFPPVRPSARGKKPVLVTFADGTGARLFDAFEYRFDQDPIIFVHGFSGQSWHFTKMLQRFEQAGWPKNMLHSVSYSSAFQSSVYNARELENVVQRVLRETGAQKVDLVAHSMGGLSTRLYLKNGGHRFVRDYVSIAGAHHGTQTAAAAPTDGAREMYPPYACEGQSLHDLQPQLNGCIHAVGRSLEADETPFSLGDEEGSVAYRSIWSTHDEIIRPPESSCLEQQKRNDCASPVNTKVSGLTHATVLTDRRVFELVYAHLTQRNPSKPDGDPNPASAMSSGLLE